MWIKKPFFEYATGTLLVVVILFFLGRIDYAIWPFQVVLTTIFAPILIAGLLYYLIRPILHLLMRFIPKMAAIFTVFSVFILLLAALIYFFGPTMKEQVTSLAELAPETVEEMEKESDNAIAQFEFAGFTGYELKSKVVGYAEKYSTNLMANIVDVLAILMNAAVVLIVVPFILFFLLKDDDKLMPHLMKYLSEEHKPEGRKVLKDVDETLSNYIVGQAIVAAAIGALMYVGYLIIGLENALLLAVFAMLLTIVPFLGPIIGVTPALFVALTSGDPLITAVKVIAVLLTVQQIEGNLITPNVMGSRLNIHPLTIILLLLIAAALYGFIGILIAIPLYAVLKTLVHNFRLFNRLRKKREISQQASSNK